MAKQEGAVKGEFYRTSATEPATQKSEEASTENATTKDELEAQKGKTEAAIKALESGESTESSTESEDVNTESSEKTQEQETAVKKHEDAVPYERFKEVNDEVKALRAEVETLRQATPAPKTEKTWEDLSVEELRKVRAYYREQSNEEGVDFINEKIASRMAREQVQQSDTAREFARVRVETWNEVVSEFPDLKNLQSAHYQETLKLVNSDQRLNREADGHAAAARIVASRILRQQMAKASKVESELRQNQTGNVKKTGLESGRRGNASAGSLDKLREAAEASGNPYGPEWKMYFRGLDQAKKTSKRE